MQYQRIAGSLFEKLLVILLVCVPVFAFAQEEEKESPFYASVDVDTKYLWRGIANGDAPLVYPTVGFNKGGFDIYGWGAYAVDNSYTEVNIGVSYSFSDFTVELVDYFYPASGNRFFDFRNSTTTHSVELIAYYEPEFAPVYLLAGSVLYGDDKNEEGKNAFSSYAELGYYWEFKERNKIDVALGFSLNKGYYTDYEKGFGLVNAAASYTRLFTVWNYDLPAYAKVAYNPYMKKFYWSVGLSFSLF